MAEAAAIQAVASMQRTVDRLSDSRGRIGPLIARITSVPSPPDENLCQGAEPAVLGAVAGCEGRSSRS